MNQLGLRHASTLMHTPAARKSGYSAGAAARLPGARGESRVIPSPGSARPRLLADTIGLLPFVMGANPAEALGDQIHLGALGPARLGLGVAGLGEGELQPLQ